MTEHEQYAEDLALYALDALTGEERARAGRAPGDVRGLPAGTRATAWRYCFAGFVGGGAEAATTGATSLIDAVAREPRTSSHSANRETLVVGAWLGWAAAAAVFIFAVSLWRENLTLRETLTSASSEAAEERPATGRTPEDRSTHS